jgi:nucleotide-binding universal stress UspA family protein
VADKTSESAPSTAPYVALVALDYSEPSEQAFAEVVKVLRDHPQASLHAVHVASAYGPMLRVEVQDDIKVVSLAEARTLFAEYVHDHLKALGDQCFQAIRPHVRVGAPSDEIVTLAKELDADLVIVGTHGRLGVKRLLLGSVAEAVVRKATCPVLVVKPKHYPEEAADD